MTLKDEEKFGCEWCWPPSADAAWEARSALVRTGELIDESHFHVMILDCRRCSQRFLSVFTEAIDWEAGDDPQYWTLLPLTKADASDVLNQPQPLTEPKLEALGPQRRCLRRAHPKGANPTTSWGSGIIVGPHD
jgi:hypothetical protein